MAYPPGLVRDVCLDAEPVVVLTTSELARRMASTLPSLGNGGADVPKGTLVSPTGGDGAPAPRVPLPVRQARASRTR